MGKILNLKDFNFHDAVIKNACFEWTKQLLKVDVSIFLHQAQKAILFGLNFLEISQIAMACQAPWGKSSVINKLREHGENKIVIEMQSRDDIVFSYQSMSMKQLGH